MNKPTFNPFNIAASLSGKAESKTARDHWLIDRTRQWPMHYCVGRWSYSLHLDRGVIRFDFELQEDADAFRIATAASNDLITCR